LTDFAKSISPCEQQSFVTSIALALSRPDLDLADLKSGQCETTLTPNPASCLESLPNQCGSGCEPTTMALTSGTNCRSHTACNHIRSTLLQLIPATDVAVMGKRPRDARDDEEDNQGRALPVRVKETYNPFHAASFACIYKG